MRFRTVFRVILIPAAIVLPVWLMVGYGIFGRTFWMFPFVVIMSIAAAIALLGIGWIARSRPTVKRTGALSWADVGLFSTWYLVIVAAGFATVFTSVFIVLAVLVGLGCFWLVMAELFADAKRAVRDTLGDFERQARTSRPVGFSPTEPRTVTGPREDGEYIVMREPK